MTEEQFHGILVWTIFLTAVVSFASLLVLAAPYGRHYSGNGWGPHISNRTSWVLMELPSVVLFLGVYFSLERPHSRRFRWSFSESGNATISTGRSSILCAFEPPARKCLFLVMACGFTFNSINAYVNARFISEFGEYGTEWLADPRFLAGLAIFLTGLALNVHSDNILLNLRKTGESGYAIPQGGAFRYVSCPNYLGEIMEWAGWALATWSPAGLAFFVYTAANLIPRARSHHQWYRARFPDYPANRKSLIPGLI